MVMLDDATKDSNFRYIKPLVDLIEEIAAATISVPKLLKKPLILWCPQEQAVDDFNRVVFRNLKVVE